MEENMTKEQMEAELKPLYIKATITRILTWCAVAVAIFMAITEDPTIALVCLVIAVVFGIQTRQATKSIGKISKFLEKMSTTDQMDDKLKSMNIKVIILRILTHGLIVMGLLTVPQNFFITLGCWIIAPVFGIPAGRTIRKRDEIKKQLSQSVIDCVIRNVLGYDVEYNPLGKINLCKEAVPFFFPLLDGKYHTKTVYNGVNIELGNVRLYGMYENNMKQTMSERVIFKGPWLICDFGKKPECVVHVFARSHYTFWQKGNVKIDNEQFCSRFGVNAKDPREAYKILTPQMMESILTVADKCGGKDVFISFLPDGKMHVGIDTGRNLFDVRKCYDAEGMRRKFSEELRRLTDIIDTLNV